MFKTFKILGAVIALLTPIVAGWAYTAGASVGDVTGPFSGMFDTVDEFSVDGYLILREEHDGIVTMSVTSPDGAALAADELPAAIAEEVAFFEHDWVEPPPSFDTRDGVGCWQPHNLLPSEEELTVSTDDDTVRVLEVLVDDIGNETVTAMEFTRDEFTEDHEEALHTGTLRLTNIEGGTPIPPCEP